MEIAMLITLALMGIYFIKSTDLPKDLKERSAQNMSESRNQPSKYSSGPLKFTLPKTSDEAPAQEVKSVAASINEKQREIKLAEMKLERKIKEIQITNEEIDRLTLTITALELEIKVNNEKNAEIEALIDVHLISLQKLQNRLASLS
jgi:septal ring factor EnvC (AmiA/AmiB activator)